MPSSFLDFAKPLDPTGLANELPSGGSSPTTTGGQQSQGQPMNAPKAYGFGSASTDQGGGESQFNQMRRQQMGMGGSSGD